ncbi:Galactose/lactose metabolism regulatory protein GAL80 [Colletotrichum trifolii]|uniref:Galactose/lactose metabolism regulatory protein GAL80 n=1 Tax=Colletotrichum trifolii TaxID=5466 RepID=A0A4R8RNH7_COLTR|nr:Galactose/lactose metabolism regulatory protein GAL80 [Colletotrichum trifolii]
MSPIRVGIIGLSAKPPGMAAGAWASSSLLPAFQKSPDYEIVALCNSSLEAAQRSIDMHQLPESTKAYGDPEQLANDHDVDLVVVSVVVTKHLQLALPALKKQKKKVFVEWPLGKSVEEAQQMTELAKANSVETIVGLQARGDPCDIRLKEIIQSGEIGKVTSTTVLGAVPAFPPEFWTEDTKQYLDIETGANAFHVIFGHFLHSFTHALGNFDVDTISSLFHIDKPTMAVYTTNGGSIADPAHPKTAPDDILVQGKLENGAAASIVFRSTQAPVEDVGLRWIITGTKGEVEVKSGTGNWQANTPTKKLKVRVFGSEAREVNVKTEGLADDLSRMERLGANTAFILDAFAKGKREIYADFEAALENHVLLEEILKRAH